jgi:hypothetical protein
VGRDGIIERERRWAVPAAVLAVAPLVLYIASIIIVQGADLAGGDSEAEQLVSLNENSGTVLLSSVVRGIGFALLTAPMLYLFLATRARNPRVQAAMVGFVFVGPILFAAQGIVQAIGADQASSEFVKLEEEEQRKYPALQQQLDDEAQKIEKVTIYSADDSLEVEQADGSFYRVENLPSDAESELPPELDAAEVENETDSATEAGPPDAQAAHVTDENGTVQVSQGLLFPSVLGLIVLMVYLPLQALRAGLLTRFLGSIGIALGASMILILPVAVLAMLAWTAFLGLLFVGRVPGGRPPARDAGEAVPWPRPGEEQPSARGRGGDDAIEGDATEVDDEGSSEDEQTSGQPQKRKRKRRS